MNILPLEKDRDFNAEIYEEPTDYKENGTVNSD